MIRFSFLGVALCMAANLLVGCADLDSQSGASVHVQPKEKVWIAFLEAHCLPDRHVEFSGSMPKITLTRTEAEKSKIANAREVLGSGDADGIIMSSGDPVIITLHQKMKTAESAIGSSREYNKALEAANQLSLVQRAYSAGPAVYTGPDPLQVLEGGGTSADINAAQAHAGRDNDLRDRNQARLDLVKQSSSVAKKAESEAKNAQAALEKVRQHYAIPASDLVSVMQHYLPAGSKGWSSDPDHIFGIQFDAIALATIPPEAARNLSNVVYLSYGTWTY